MSLLEKKLTKEWADEVIREEKRLISAIIYDLQEMGKAIAAELELKDYESIEKFFEEHDQDKSPFDVLEGQSEREGDLIVLNQCPMTKLLKEVSNGGQLPDFYSKIVEKYKEIHKSKGAILHPFCIVHQVIRATVGDHVKVQGKKMRVYQVACRSMTTGNVVFAEEGMMRVNMGEDEVKRKISGKACMYLLKH